MAKFNERLKLLRRESGLSQQDFAKQLGTSKSSVNMYERGEREPGIETLEAIADYFNVDMDYLLGKSDHRSKSAWLEDIDNSIDLDILRSQVKFENLFPIERKRYFCSCRNALHTNTVILKVQILICKLLPCCL